MQNKTNSSQLGLLMVMLASMLWSTGNIVAKFVLQSTQTNSTSVAFFRMAISVPALLILCGLVLRRRMFQLSRRDLLPMLIAGSFVAMYQATFYAALPRIGVGIATLIALCSAPVIVAVLSAILSHQRPRGVVLMALACAIAGTLFLVQQKPGTQQPQTDVVGGALLALFAGLLYALNVIIGGRLGANRNVHPLQTVTFGFTFGTVILLLISLNSGLVINYPAQGWAGLIYLGVITTAIAYAMFYAGMRSTSSTAASIATLMEPLTATLLAWWVFNEALSPQVLLGGGLLLAAMLLLMLERK